MRLLREAYTHAKCHVEGRDRGSERRDCTALLLTVAPLSGGGHGTTEIERRRATAV